MKKLILTPVLALAMTAGMIAPAHANPTTAEPMFTVGSFSSLIGLLLPAVQHVRESAQR